MLAIHNLPQIHTITRV